MGLAVLARWPWEAHICPAGAPAQKQTGSQEPQGLEIRLGRIYPKARAEEQRCARRPWGQWH